MEDIVPKFAADKYKWLKPQLFIDFLDLDEALSRSAVLVQMAGEYASVAIEIRNSEKVKLETIYSQAAVRLRSTLLDGGKERSQARIDSELPTQPEVVLQQEICSEARVDAGLWESVVDGFRTKSAALRTAADMVQSGLIDLTAMRTKGRPAPYQIPKRETV